jgi:putative ABC transport system ATP-binding protein
MHIELRDLVFAYQASRIILDIPELNVERGERVFLHGPSGSGKTTLLGLLGGVLTAKQGAVRLLDRDFAALSARERDRFRGSHIGFIFQMFNLIPYLSALDNIMLPCRINAERRARLAGVAVEDAARAMAVTLGIGEVADMPVTQLSVGQQQRVAAARAFLGAPELIIADEPTSALDADHRERFIRALFEAAASNRATVLFVSHDRSLASLFDRSLALPQLNRASRN